MIVYLAYILTAIFLFWIMRKAFCYFFPQWKKNSTAIAVVMAILGTPFIAPLIFMTFFSFALYEYHPERSFSAESWHEQRQDRHEMSADILEDDLFVGKSMQEIASLIGKPEREIPGAEDRNLVWRYDMGSRGWGMGLKFYHMLVTFEDDKAVHVEVGSEID